MSTYWSANQIITQASAEVGLTPVLDPIASADPAFRQMRYLLDAVGKELLRMSKWESLVVRHLITTPSLLGDGVYDLPADFGYMIPQTSWNETDAVPLFGPLSAQDWSYLEGRGLVSSTIYISFRLQRRKFTVFPNDTEQSDKNLFFEYISTGWVEDVTGARFSEIQQGTDIVLYPEILAVKFLKVKFLEAKGFDSSKARDDFNELLDSTIGQDKSAPVLNAGGWGNTFPYLDSWYNTPNSGFGSF